jgi:hypothetical protein
MSLTASQNMPAFGGQFMGFMDFLRDEAASTPILSPKRFSQILNIDLPTLAGQAHVHRNTINRAPESESVQRFLREVVRVLRAATDINKDVALAIFWYRNEPLPSFAYKTAEQLVVEGRSEDVLRYVTSLEAAAAG